jgi:hypothetical protein
MRWLLVVGGVVAAGTLLDRLLLFAEQRGWIYWRRRKPSASAAGNALLSVQAIFEPDRAHVVEEQARQEADIDAAEGDEPMGGPRGR